MSFLTHISITYVSYQPVQAVCKTCTPNVTEGLGTSWVPVNTQNTLVNVSHCMRLKCIRLVDEYQYKVSWKDISKYMIYWTLIYLLYTYYQQYYVFWLLLHHSKNKTITLLSVWLRGYVSVPHVYTFTVSDGTLVQSVTHIYESVWGVGVGYQVFSRQW